MTSLRIDWEYDPEDEVQRSAESQTFFAAWVNQFGIVEWTCTDPELFSDLEDLME